MKASICLFAVFVAVSSFAVEVGALPGAEVADTEVSTNVALAVGAAGNRRLVFSVELQASPSNNVEVAVGHDADGDGSLSLDESAFAVGYDCGEWFTLLAASDAVTCEPVSDSGTFHRVYSIRAVNVDPLWNLAKITRRGFGYAGETVVVELVSSGFMLKML